MSCFRLFLSRRARCRSVSGPGRRVGEGQQVDPSSIAVCHERKEVTM